jgi:hypothetical protein
MCTGENSHHRECDDSTGHAVAASRGCTLGKPVGFGMLGQSLTTDHREQVPFATPLEGRFRVRF